MDVDAPEAVRVGVRGDSVGGEGCEGGTKGAGRRSEGRRMERRRGAKSASGRAHRS